MSPETRERNPGGREGGALTLGPRRGSMDGALLKGPFNAYSTIHHRRH